MCNKPYLYLLNVIEQSEADSTSFRRVEIFIDHFNLGYQTDMFPRARVNRKDSAFDLQIYEKPLSAFLFLFLCYHTHALAVRGLRLEMEALAQFSHG